VRAFARAIWMLTKHSSICLQHTCPHVCTDNVRSRTCVACTQNSAQASAPTSAGLQHAYQPQQPPYTPQQPVYGQTAYTQQQQQQQQPAYAAQPAYASQQPAYNAQQPAYPQVGIDWTDGLRVTCWGQWGRGGGSYNAVPPLLS